MLSASGTVYCWRVSFFAEVKGKPIQTICAVGLVNGVNSDVSTDGKFPVNGRFVAILTGSL